MALPYTALPVSVSDGRDVTFEADCPICKIAINWRVQIGYVTTDDEPQHVAKSYYQFGPGCHCG